MKQSSLLGHLDVDPRCLGVRVSHHILDCFDVHTLLDQQRSEGVAQRVGRDFRVADTDAPEPLLHDAPDGLPDQTVIAPALVGDKQWIVLREVSVRDILLQPFDGVRMQDDDLVFVRAALALDVEDRLTLALREVADIDSFYFAGA